MNINLKIKKCEHDFKYYNGNDYNERLSVGPLERYCSACGRIEIYSGLAREWVEVGNINEL